MKDNNSGNILFQGPSREGLYPLHLGLHHKNKSASSPSVMFTSIISTGVWHNRRGHPGQATLRQLSKLLQLSGSIPTTKVCSACQMEKSSKLPFFKIFFFSSSPLQLVHSDIWGSSHFHFISGVKFYITFIDVLLNLSFTI